MRRFALLVGLAAVLAGCAELEPKPEPTPSKVDPRVVWAVTGEAGETANAVRYSLKDWPTNKLDPVRAERLARVLFPDVSVGSVGDKRRIEFRTEESAEAFVNAARWADGMVLALNTIESAAGQKPLDPAGVILENLRRYFLVGTPLVPPDWAAVSKALDEPSVWETSPTIAGMGAIIFAGLIRKGAPRAPAEERAEQLLGRAVALRNVPEWLSWIAQLNWVRRHLSASEETPK